MSKDGDGSQLIRFEQMTQIHGEVSLENWFR